jgi:CRISPR/Cas system-associated exonuclease Cas4 (RecB family)
MNRKEAAKLAVLSKSRMGTYNRCPLGFKYSYVDKMESLPNPYFARGIEVHSFFEHFFDKIKIDGEKLKIKALDYSGETMYKKNIVEYLSKKWYECIDKKPEDPEKYFRPVLMEKMLEINNGIRARGKADGFVFDLDDKWKAFEVKTGMVTHDKCVSYKNDLVWYKMLLEANKTHCKHFGIDSIDYGLIYFPHSNYVYEHEIFDHDVEVLREDIAITADKILRGDFDPNPELSNCKWCGYRLICEHSVCKV